MLRNKLKVVWICHFSNSEMQSYLPLWRKKNEFASWIPNILKGFENLENIELHVISPHEYLRKNKNFSLRNIKYHFIPSGMPILHRHWPNKLRLDLFTNFWSFRVRVKKIINSVSPDIINLHGVENAYYSMSILDFEKTYPILITIQGFISEHKDIIRLSKEVRNRIRVEEKILRSFKYFSGEQDSSIYIKSYNPKHTFYRLYYPINEKYVQIIGRSKKKYDCVFFGRITKSKGVEDFINVIAELKKTKPNVSSIIIGGGSVVSFIKMAEKLNCKENIEFAGFIKSQKELFELVKSSRVFLVPTHRERLSSTIREAMQLKIPIVAYATGGIPFINEHDENILLVKTGDFKEMANKTLQLLKDKKLSGQLSEKAFIYSKNEYSLHTNTDRFINAYYSILKEYKSPNK